MIITHMFGGLGNQMSMYAFGRYLSIKNKCDLKIDISDYVKYKLHDYSLHHFDIKAKLATPDEINALKTSFMWGICGLSKESHYKEHGMVFEPQAMELGDDHYIEGYWASEKYFVDIADIIRKDFSIKERLDIYNEEGLKRIVETKGTPVSIHVRRGDYLNNPAFRTLTMDYYKEAIKTITKSVDRPHFFVFSDDISWAGAALSKLIDYDKHQLSIMNMNGREHNYIDIVLMGKCHHHIIANSSFSWWGAWLNPKKDKIVVSPREWYTLSNNTYNMSTLIPESWIKI